MGSMESGLSNIPAQTVAKKFLNSWKQIARYLGRGVRTVQRWEKELGLPVRRPRGRQRSAVIAMTAELDAWLDSHPHLITGPKTENARTVLHGNKQQTSSLRKLRFSH